MLPFWAAVTVLGEPEVWVAITSLVLLYAGFLRIRRRERQDLKRFSVLLTVGMWVTFIIVLAAKDAFAVPRSCVPCDGLAAACNPLCPLDPHDYSFPSGHAAAVFAFFTTVALTQKRVAWGALGLAVLVAASRVAVGVHTPADVAAGALVGILATLLSARLLDGREGMRFTR